MIEKYQLFDFNMKPQNINLRSNTSVDRDQQKNSIDASFNNGKSHILAQDGYEDFKQAEELNRSAQNTARDAPISGQLSHTQPATANSRQNPFHQAQRSNVTASSPRTNLSEKLKLEKQIAKLEEMKQDALAKLVGLNKF